MRNDINEKIIKNYSEVMPQQSYQHCQNSYFNIINRKINVKIIMNFEHPTPKINRPNTQESEFLDSYCDSRQEFSFNRPTKRSNLSNKQKYQEIYQDLREMEPEDVIELLLQQIQENEETKIKLHEYRGSLTNLQQQLKSARESVRRKGQAITILCETQSKNLQLIEKLESKLCRKKQYPKDTHYQKKYHELSIYMNQYIRSINQTQDQFRRAYGNLKGENQRLKLELENSHICTHRQEKRVQMKLQQVKRLQYEIGELYDKKKVIEHNMLLMKQQNQILRKQIQVYQQNIRITDRLEANHEHENQQLSSELDFIKDKMLENQNISKDIIDRLEESSSNCEKIMKAKESLNQSLMKQRQKCNELEKQVGILRKKNEHLSSEYEKMDEKYQQMTKDKSKIEEEYQELKGQKLKFEKELKSMGDKMKIIEETYQREISRSDKIKEELSKFWENKQKSDSTSSHSQKIVLSELRMNQSEMNSLSVCQFPQLGTSPLENIQNKAAFLKKSSQKPSYSDKQNFGADISESSIKSLRK